MTLEQRIAAICDRWERRSVEKKQESMDWSLLGENERALVCWSDYLMYRNLAGEIRTELEPGRIGLGLWRRDRKGIGGWDDE
jgi:hypothetical protein